MDLLSKIAHRLLESGVSDLSPTAIDGPVYKVEFKDVAFICEAADTMDRQVIGMQKYSSIPKTFGMIFPQETPRRVSFHMGAVPFPLDLIFITDNKVAKIEHDVQPGSAGVWTFPKTSCVVEISGGLSKEYGIDIGSPVNISKMRTAQEVFDPSHQRPDWHVRRPVQPMDPATRDRHDDRFRDRDLVDEQVAPSKDVDKKLHHPMDTNFENQQGYDPSNRDLEDSVGPWARPGSKTSP